jgi:two-component system chemotaxis response regulator CheY
VDKGVKSTSFELSGTGRAVAVPREHTVVVRPAETAPADLGVAELSVILVEPSRTQAGIIRRFLSKCGIEQVVIKASGRDAEDAVRAGRADVVVSTMHLDDMTGVELAQKLWAEHQNKAPGFLLISTTSQSENSGSLSKVANARILTKPFTIEQLAESLSAVTRRTVASSGRSSVHAPATDPKLAARARFKVLIVDDSAAARLHERGILQSLGFIQFTEAVDGAQAVAHTAGATFDLVVTDYNMPHMDGRGLVGYLRQNPATANVPIIVVTTETDPAKLAEVQRLGASAICDKRFTVEIVRALLEQLLGQ